MRQWLTIVAGLCLLWPVHVYACPFCRVNLASNSGTFAHGITVGLGICILLMLTVIGVLITALVFMAIKEGKKSSQRALDRFHSSNH